MENRSVYTLYTLSHFLLFAYLYCVNYCQQKLLDYIPSFLSILQNYSVDLNAHILVAYYVD